ncbi:MAG: 3-dehydroquinate synthase [Myxococcales bacterium]|nr:3-dehydroquinate synthase [Myxococcales bacterium]
MKTLFVSGFMGTGKSTIAPRVASELGLPYVDTDAVLASRSGRAGATAASLVRDDERSFRAAEEALVLELASAAKPSVVALGGGALVSSRARAAALASGVVVTLKASREALLARLAGTERPLLGGDPAARIDELQLARAAAYSECHGEVWTDVLDEDAAVAAVCAVRAAAPVLVALGERSYRVHVVHDRPEVLTDVVAALGPSGLLAVTDSHVLRARGTALARALDAVFVPHRTCTLPPGEEHKTLATVDTIWEAGIAQGLDRDGVFVAFGGGVVGDLTGFAAATLYRGVRAVQVPTTLLAMVDASVGGKTGFDVAAGKNLIGAFAQPSAVVVDLAHLSTLPARHRRAGLAELAKIALLLDEGLARELRERAPELVAGPPEGLASVVRRAIELKAGVVARDEREQGDRALLNFGHTVGHALEAHGQYRTHLHGEAVAIGMVAELELAAAAGLVRRGVAGEVESLLEALGLPTRPAGGELAAAAAYLGVDKKRRGERLRLPLAVAVGRGEVLPVLADDLRTAMRRA